VKPAPPQPDDIRTWSRTFGRAAQRVGRRAIALSEFSERSLPSYGFRASDRPLPLQELVRRSRRSQGTFYDSPVGVGLARLIGLTYL